MNKSTPLRSAVAGMHARAGTRRLGLGARSGQVGVSRLGLSLDPFRACLVLLIILAVSRIHQHFRSVAAMRPALILAAVAVVLVAMRPDRVSLGNVLRLWPSKVVLGMAGMAVLSAFFGLSLGGSAQFILEDYSKLVVLFVLLVASVRTARDLATVVWAYLIGCGVLVWLAWFVFGISAAAGSHVVRLSRLYTFDANDIGCVLAIGLGLSLWTLQTSRRAGKLLSGVLVLAIGVTMARSGSRGAFLGVLVMGLVVLAGLRQVAAWKRVLAVLVVGGALAVAAPPGYWEQMRTILQPSEDYNLQSGEGRWQVWRRGLGYVAQYPVFGVGINNFKRAEYTISDKARMYVPGTPLRLNAPHNTYLQAAVELGIPGFLLWSAVTVGSVVGVRRLRRRLPVAWAHGAPAERFLFYGTVYVPVAMIGFIVTSFFLTFAFLDPPYVLIAIVAGLYAAVENAAFPGGGDRINSRGVAPVVNGKAGDNVRRA